MVRESAGGKAGWLPIKVIPAHYIVRPFVEINVPIFTFTMCRNFNMSSQSLIPKSEIVRMLLFSSFPMHVLYLQHKFR